MRAATGTARQTPAACTNKATAWRERPRLRTRLVTPARSGRRHSAASTSTSHRKVVVREQAGRRGWRARNQASQRRWDRLGKRAGKKSRDMSDTITMVSDMKTNIRLQQIETQIAQIKKELVDLGPLHPGSLSR